MVLMIIIIEDIISITRKKAVKFKWETMFKIKRADDGNWLFFIIAIDTGHGDFL